MWRAALSVLSLAGCETCGDSAEPLMEVIATIDVATASPQVVHASMFNPQGEFVNGMYSYVSQLDEPGRWSYTLGDCDGTPQTSGTFTVYGWVDDMADRFVERPTAVDPQGMDLVDVTCNPGCSAARTARITIQ